MTAPGAQQMVPLGHTKSSLSRVPQLRPLPPVCSRGIKETRNRDSKGIKILFRYVLPPTGARTSYLNQRSEPRELSVEFVFCCPGLQHDGPLVSWKTSYSTKNLAATVAKLLQSCLTLCNPIDGSPPGSPIPGILQARTLEWVPISFSNAWKWKVKVKSFSRARLLATPWPWDFPG